LGIPITMDRFAMARSASMMTTLLPREPSAMPKLAVRTVFPVPPLPEQMEIERGFGLGIDSLEES
jgi:hypothetical protein